MTKTDWYKTNKRLIFHLAWTFSRRHGFEMEELTSEFNVVFCECFDKYDPDWEIPFHKWFCICCVHRIGTLVIKRNRKKRACLLFTGDELCILSHDPVESVLVYDSFVNHKNPVIRRIAEIISIYPTPKDGLKKMLRKYLLKDKFTNPEINKAFKILHNSFDPA